MADALIFFKAINFVHLYNLMDARGFQKNVTLRDSFPLPVHLTSCHFVTLYTFE